MKHAYRPTRIASLRLVGVGALVALSLGCNRKEGDGVPGAPVVPEVPMAPRIDPAKPALEEMRKDALPATGSPAASETASGEAREAEASFKSAPNVRLSGDAKLKEIATGVTVLVELDQAPPGKKGIHIHEKGNCSDIPGKSMGEHFAPNAAAHGLPPHTERHLGDLGNISIGQDGKARLEITVSNANLKENDPMSFLGRALVIHAGEDKGTQPSGDSGKPIACAVIEKD